MNLHEGHMVFLCYAFNSFVALKVFKIKKKILNQNIHRNLNVRETEFNVIFSLKREGIMFEQLACYVMTQPINIAH